MRDLEHARLMLRLAKDDLTALEVMASSPRISLGIFGFHAQQGETVVRLQPVTVRL